MHTHPRRRPGCGPFSQAGSRGAVGGGGRGDEQQGPIKPVFCVVGPRALEPFSALTHLRKETQSPALTLGRSEKQLHLKRADLGLTLRAQAEDQTASQVSGRRGTMGPREGAEVSSEWSPVPPPSTPPPAPWLYPRTACPASVVGPSLTPVAIVLRSVFLMCYSPGWVTLRPSEAQPPFRATVQSAHFHSVNG